jgi:predicted nucleic acid-binding protein
LIFVDTSYFVALLDQGDKWHDRAKELSKQVGSEELMTSGLVISECVTVIGSRGGGRVARSLYDSILDNCRIVFLTKDLLLDAMEVFLEYDGRVSVTDSASVALMRAHGIENIVSFSEDSDFDKIDGIIRIF